MLFLHQNWIFWGHYGQTLVRRHDYSGLFDLLKSQIPLSDPHVTFCILCCTQELCLDSLIMVMPTVKVLALTHRNLSVDVVMNFLKCFS
jgi:hypothetical protein